MSVRGNSKTTVNKKKKRRVRFFGNVQFKTIRHVCDFSNQEIRDGWYSKKDYARMSKEISNILKLIANGHESDDGSEGGNGGEICTRGLELFLDQTLADFRQDKMLESLDVVLEEQDSHRGDFGESKLSADDFVDMISKKYADICAPLQQQAYLVALRDAAEARHLLDNSNSNSNNNSSSQNGISNNQLSSSSTATTTQRPTERTNVDVPLVTPQSPRFSEDVESDESSYDEITIEDDEDYEEITIEDEEITIEDDDDFVLPEDDTNNECISPSMTTNNNNDECVSPTPIGEINTGVVVIESNVMVGCGDKIGHSKSFGDDNKNKITTSKKEKNRPPAHPRKKTVVPKQLESKTFPKNTILITTPNNKLGETRSITLPPPSPRKTVPDGTPPRRRRSKVDRRKGTEVSPFVRRRDGTLMFRNKEYETKQKMSKERKETVRSSLFKHIDSPQATKLIRNSLRRSENGDILQFINALEI